MLKRAERTPGHRRRGDRGEKGQPSSPDAPVSEISRDLRLSVGALVLAWIAFLAAYPGSLFLWNRGWAPLLALLALAGGWCLYDGLQRGGLLSRRDWPLWLSIGGLTGWFLAPEAAGRAFVAWAHLAVIALALFYLGKCLAVDRPSREGAAALLLLTAAGVALYAVAEHLAGFNPLYEYYWPNRQYEFYRVSGRPLATQFNMVPLASLMLAAIPFGLVRFGRRAGGRILILGVLSLLIASLLLTRSRGPFLGLILIGLLLLLLRRRFREAAVALVVLAALVGAADRLPGEWSRFGYRRLLSGPGGVISEYRLTRVRMAVAMAEARPLTGRGFMQFREQFYAYHPDPERAGSRFRTADNMYLTLLVETGLLGLGTFVLFALWLLVPALASLWRAGAEAVRGPPVAVLLAFVGLLIGLGHYNLLYHTGPAMLFFLVAGLQAGLLQRGAFDSAGAGSAGDR